MLDIYSIRKQMNVQFRSYGPFFSDVLRQDLLDVQDICNLFLLSS